MTVIGPNGLTSSSELRLCRLTAIADRVEEIEAETERLLLERAGLFAELRLDEPYAPTELLARFARVTDGAVFHQFRAEEERRGLPRGALGRGRTKRATA